jgi:FMN reductase
MTRRKLVVVSAGLSKPSSTRLLSDQLSSATEKALSEHGVESILQTVELRDHAHALMNNLLAHFPSPELGHAINVVLQADGLIAVTPIFNASYSGLFKVFFDVLEADSLTDKPVLIAATGGTARHSLALEHAMRPLFAYLRSVVVPTSVFAAPEDWGTNGSEDPSLASRVDRAARQLAALMLDRGFDAPPDPYDDPTPFEQLLAGGPD